MRYCWPQIPPPPPLIDTLYRCTGIILNRNEVFLTNFVLNLERANIFRLVFCLRNNKEKLTKLLYYSDFVKVSEWANNQKLRLRMTDDFSPPDTCPDGRCRDMSDDFIYIVIVPVIIVVVFAVVLGILVFRRRTKR